MDLKNGQVEIIFCGSDGKLDLIKAQIEKSKGVRLINIYDYEVDDKLFSSIQ